MGTLALKRFLPLIATLDAMSSGKQRTVRDVRAQGYLLYSFSAHCSPDLHVELKCPEKGEKGPTPQLKVRCTDSEVKDAPRPCTQVLEGPQSN